MTGRQPSTDQVLDREEALWTEIIRCEMDSWRPRRLPRHFELRARRASAPKWGTVPLLVTGCLVVLTGALLAGTSTSSGGVLRTLAGMRSAAISGPPAHGATPLGRAPVRQAPRSVPSGRSVHRGEGGANSAPPSPLQPGRASAARDNTPAPSATPSPPQPTLLPLPSGAPSPLIVPPNSSPAVSGETPPGVAVAPPPASTPTPSSGQ